MHSTYRWRGRNSTTDMELNPKVRGLLLQGITLNYNLLGSMLWIFPRIFYCRTLFGGGDRNKNK